MEQDRSIDRSVENTRHASITFGRKVKSRGSAIFSGESAELRNSRGKIRKAS